jgi:type II secretory pathway component GspD/PulD (secretin)
MLCGHPAMKFLAMALTLHISVTSARADDARIIQLKHRTAAEVIPLIRPLLGSDDTLSGLDYRLIIRTSDKNLKEIERILGQVDVARKQFRITVEQTTAEERDRTSQSVSGEIRVGDNARIVLPEKSPDESGLVVQKDRLRYDTVRRTTTARNTSTQTVMTLEGQRAYIRIGQSIPHVKRILALSRHQLALIQDVELQNVTTGFEVLPRVRGDRVQLEITPRLSSLQNPGIGLVNFQELSTTVETKRGEWLDLGQILGNRSEVERAILESAATTSGERRIVRLKVE